MGWCVPSCGHPWFAGGVTVMWCIALAQAGLSRTTDLHSFAFAPTDRKSVAHGRRVL